MRYTKIFVYLLLLIIACQKSPLLKPGYDFYRIKTIAIEEIKDYPYNPESGAAVAGALARQLTKFGLNAFESKSLGIQSCDAIIMCSILEFKDQRPVFIPMEIIDKDNSASYAESAYAQTDSTSKTATGTSKTSYYQSSLTRTKEIQFIDAVVGLTLQLVDVNDRTILWSSNYIYTALNQTDALNKCVAGALKPLQKILKK